MKILKNADVFAAIKQSDLPKKRFSIDRDIDSWKCLGQPQELYIMVKACCGLRPGQHIRRFSNGAFFATREFMVEYEYKIILTSQVDMVKLKDSVLQIR